MPMVTMAKSLRLALAVGAEPAIGNVSRFSDGSCFRWASGIKRLLMLGREGTVTPFQFPGKQKSAEGFHAGRILLLWHSSPE